MDEPLQVALLPPAGVLSLAIVSRSIQFPALRQLLPASSRRASLAIFPLSNEFDAGAL
jgi:hypothetical protein